jgi:hypothetical protein
VEITCRVYRPPGVVFSEITPDVPLPRQPGGGTPERTARTVDLPRLDLDAWGWRVFRRGLR